MMEQSPFLVLKIGLTRFLSMRLVRGSVSLTVGQKRAGPKGTDPQSVPTLQKKILAQAAACVKPGGRLLYSTCTLERDENSRVRTAFLESHPEFRSKAFLHPVTGERVEELQILPWRDGIDGFYLALFEKVE